MKMLLILLVLLIQDVFAAELTIADDHAVRVFSSEELLASSKLEMITITNNRAYPDTKMTLASIKICQLLKPFSIRPEYFLELIASDGFSVYIPAKKLLACDSHTATAYLAIEPPSKWPLLFNHTNTTAGPFDVIWLHPEKSYISNEYWAWSVVKIIVRKKLDNDLLKLQPHTSNTQIKHGYEIYISHCAGCHTINHKGKATIGPDLKYPKTPFDYYPDEGTLQKFIRDPQSIRPGRMSGSGADYLNDRDLQALIRYLRQATIT